jgi:hypothetical protein
MKLMISVNGPPVVDLKKETVVPLFEMRYVSPATAAAVTALPAGEPLPAVYVVANQVPVL